MATGNFSNGGRDTHDPTKHYMGLRLQQGVPWMDRDHNEESDIRRYYERMLRANYIGNGVPDLTGFKITAPTSTINNQFVIGAGRCMIGGYDVQNETPILYRDQPGAPSLPNPTQADTFHVYLQAAIVRVDSTMDSALRNQQDINFETCLRDKLNWVVQVARAPNLPPANTYLLAIIRRPAGANVITQAMIEDTRRTQLNLAQVVDQIIAQATILRNLEASLQRLQLETQRIKDQLARLFWDVELTLSQTNVYFGDSVSVTVIVHDGTGQPVRNASLLFSTDWGSLNPSSAVTNNDGRATFEVYGVEADTPPARADLAIMGRAARKVSDARVADTGALQYNRIRFEPEELTLLSRYTPPAAISDISYNLPNAPVIAIPPSQTLTVTVYAKESGRNVVRGIGSVQVRYGMWIRDWTRDVIYGTAVRVPIDTHVGDLIRQGVRERTFDPGVIVQRIPGVLDNIHQNTRAVMRDSIFVDPHGGDERLQQTGILGQTIAQASTTIIGARVEAAVGTQLNHFVQDNSIELDAKGAQQAFTAITNTTSQHTAGRAQQNKQLFNSGINAAPRFS
jgi:Bacterial Ig-like domain (group 1)